MIRLVDAHAEATRHSEPIAVLSVQESEEGGRSLS
jgi:hypothetical protein